MSGEHWGHAILPTLLAWPWCFTICCGDNGTNELCKRWDPYVYGHYPYLSCHCPCFYRHFLCFYSHYMWCCSHCSLFYGH